MFKTVQKKFSKGFSLRNVSQRGRGFSLIELIVVIAIIGILVMLATPKFMGYVEASRIANIQNDTKVTEDKVEELLINETELPEDWELVEQEDLDKAVDEKKLYGKGGLVAETNTKEELVIDGEYKVVPKDFIVKEARSKLEGNFYASNKGKVYYEDLKSGSHKPGKPGKPGDKDDGTIKDIEDSITEVEDDLNNAGPNPSGDDIKDLEDKVDDIQDEIDKLPEGPEKDKAQDDLDKVKDEIDKKKEDNLVKEIEDLLDQLEDKVNKEDLDGVDDLIKDIQDKIDKLPEGPKKDDLRDRLDDLIDRIEELRKVDKTELEKVIAEAEKLDKKHYVGGWANLESAIQNGKNVRDDKDATREGVSKAIKDIEDAIKGLAESILARDSDFENVNIFNQATGESYMTQMYNGRRDVVEIPHTIKGKSVTSYENMFFHPHGSLHMKKVISTNPNITNMNQMFKNTSWDNKVGHLDLSELNTSGVTDMSEMFSGNKAGSIDLSNFNTSSVTNMERMFADSQATELDLTSFNISKVTNFKDMFRSSNIETVYVKTQQIADRLDEYETGAWMKYIEFIVRP